MQDKKMTAIPQNGIPRNSKISNSFFIIQSQLAIKIPNALVLCWYCVTPTVQKRTISISSYTRSKNDSHYTKSHSTGFQNIKLVLHYSKSVSCKNSKCLDFVLEQVTPIVEKGTFSTSCYIRSESDSHSTKWHTKRFQNIKLVSPYSKSVSRNNSKCLDFVLLQVTNIVQKRHHFTFMPYKVKK